MCERQEHIGTHRWYQKQSERAWAEDERLLLCANVTDKSRIYVCLKLISSIDRHILNINSMTRINRRWQGRAMLTKWDDEIYNEPTEIWEKNASNVFSWYFCYVLKQIQVDLTCAQRVLCYETCSLVMNMVKRIMIIPNKKKKRKKNKEKNRL